MRIIAATALLGLVAACSDMENVQVPLRGPALAELAAQPDSLMISGKARLPVEPPAATTFDLLYVTIEGTTLRIDGVESAALTRDEAREAAIDVEAFLNQGSTTCVTNADGLATCSVAGFDLARFLTGRVHALPG